MEESDDQEIDLIVDMKQNMLNDQKDFETKEGNYIISNKSI